jgi:hypothetical protein
MEVSNLSSQSVHNHQEVQELENSSEFPEAATQLLLTLLLYIIEAN